MSEEAAAKPSRGMWVLLAAIVAVVAVVIAAGSLSSGSFSDGSVDGQVRRAAATMAERDEARDQVPYEKVVGSLAERCVESPDAIAGMVGDAWVRGAPAESRLEVARALSTALPSGSGGEVDCREVLAAVMAMEAAR